MNSTKKKSVTRRRFLRSTAAAAGGLVAAPYVITSTALGAKGRAPASERIVLGAIGLGPRGTSDLGWMMNEPDLQFVAICDIRKIRREAIKQMADKKYGNKDCAMYRDLREILADRGDIDAMLIATGDRWHSLASILAMKAGKDVYCEKPGSLTIAEGRALADTAKRYARVFQTGTQRLSEANFVFPTELARNGIWWHARTHPVARIRRPLHGRAHQARRDGDREPAPRGNKCRFRAHAQRRGDSQRHPIHVGNSFPA